VTRHAVGDIQGCCQELRSLLARLSFNSDRDRLWLVGDLVNRGPESLQTLRLVRALGDSAIVVLGNHDLHLLAVALGVRRKRKSDTLDDVLEAPDRDALIEWLLTRPLAHLEGGDLMVHAGLVPQWSAEEAVQLAHEVEAALRADPRTVLEHMYGDEPDQWSPQLAGQERLRFTINVLTRIRVCTPAGRIDLKMKGKPPKHSAYKPWFELDTRRSRGVRVVFGHWSALGLVNSHGVLGLDSGCVWGGALTCVNLDSGAPPVMLPCTAYQEIGSG
jgi:bis(5'-nucleosyl)-tetraphosphatase (symmetrical)